MMTKKISAGYCFGVMLCFMMSIFLRFLTQNILIEIVHINNTFTQAVFFDRPLYIVPVTINWAKLYPFQGIRNGSVHTTVLDSFTGKITNIEKKIEQYTTELLVNRVFFVETAAGYEKMLGWNLHETVIDLGDGFITEQVKQVDVQPPATALVEFNDFLKDLNIDLLYVQSPHKICKYDTVAGLSDFSNQNADELLHALDSRHIPHLDLREYIHEQQLDHHSLFYKTDHHWKAETGLWATKIIGAYLNTHNGFAIDTSIFDPDRYRYEVYKNWFLGSIGKKVTLMRTQPEDISLMYPLWDTNLTLQIPSLQIDTQGTFDIVYGYDRITKIDYYNLSPYGAYIYGDNPITIIHNNLSQDGKKVLFIKDSFVNVVDPFCALGVENVEVVDIRHFTGSVQTYIEQSKPDIVIVMYNPSAINMDTSTHRATFDFR
ncbi:MAG: hypothetical protein LBU17_01480 [Treponema sp.]|nr:hypothetical protein [Treponema sp.]